MIIISSCLPQQYSPMPAASPTCHEHSLYIYTYSDQTDPMLPPFRMLTNNKEHFSIKQLNTFVFLLPLIWYHLQFKILATDCIWLLASCAPRNSFYCSPQSFFWITSPGDPPFSFQWFKTQPKGDFFKISSLLDDPVPVLMLHGWVLC